MQDYHSCRLTLTGNAYIQYSLNSNFLVREEQNLNFLWKEANVNLQEKEVLIF